ncbi:S41 family peptidase [Epilithonimonas xixisoli]|uniref:Carboxyl-terminal processing protease n=1 Tax=Epilithonimonas xixisoli TaxID=1476462 RepID=A0A4R8I4Q0_9FLAO|nr:S41 family peptidase [Epilithonimonas xixisoli]TDX83294.1 carboxyl-terminal processing protease [Epilithonimonas xixisoli]
MTIKLFFAILLFFSINFSFAQSKYQKDFSEFWTDINNHYAYLDQQNIEWRKVREIYEPKAEKISNDQEFIQLFESVLNELHNGHSSLSTNLHTSNRLIPSGSDFYVEKVGNKFFVTDLRKGFGADLSGMKIGMEVTTFNGKPIDEQLRKFLPKFTNQHNPKMHQYAIDMLFAGTYDAEREITVIENGKSKIYKPVSYRNRDELLYSKIIDDQTAYIKINNSLGNNALISEFDKTLDSLFQYKNLIIDLTETPGGGNSTVARAIMGRFTSKLLPYQIHEFDEKEYETKRHWTEFVTPRKEIYKGNVYVLVGHWTGSMGEGIAIGFDGMERAKIIGTKMAGLLGAISNFQMKETKIGFQFPTERLYHINGTPRENYVPTILTKNIEETLQKVKELTKN